MTGGISVGDYDFVGKALNDLNVNQVFYKVNQKPGKPLYYGEKGNVKIFALPGNPAAALTCFYVYVLTAIKNMMGENYSGLEKRNVTISHDHIKKGNRAHLLKAQVVSNKVTVHKGQSSAMLSSYVDANCLLYVDSETNLIESGDEVEVLMLP
jgi:molybdopterin molybdotransferase